MFGLGPLEADLERLKELKALIVGSVGKSPSEEFIESILEEFVALTMKVRNAREEFAREWDNSSLD
jgi:hypothetical protein